MQDEQRLNLAHLRALHAASTQGKWRYDGMHNEITTPGGESYWLIISECRSAPDQAQKEEFGHGFDANFAFIAAIHNAFPALLDRLEAAERERDALQMRLNGRNATGGRDALLKRLGAAEAWDIVAERSRLVGDTAGEKYATEEAARLRREAPL